MSEISAPQNGPNPRRKLSRWFLVVAAVAIFVELLVASTYSDNKQHMVLTMKSLRKGMVKSEAMRLLDEKSSHCSLAKELPTEVVCWASVGLTSSWGITATFSADGALETARISTEDGPYHPSEAPPNIQ